MILPIFQNRDFTRRAQPSIQWQVQRLEWNARGGPESAVLKADDVRDAGVLLAQGAVDLLRCPLEVLDNYGMPAWWGMVQRIELALAGMSAAWDLDALANRVAVLYTASSASTPWSSRWQLTPWADDAASQSRFGVRERILRLPQADTASAMAARDRLLAQAAWPAPSLAVLVDGGSPHLLLTAKGWQHSFDWITAPQNDGQLEYTPAGGVHQALGASSSVTALGQSLTLTQAGAYGRIWLRVGRQGAPGDALRVALHADQGGSPAATAISSVLTPASSLHASPQWELFNFPAAVRFNAGESLWVVITRSASPSSVNYYEVDLDEGAYYPGGLCKVHNGSSWGPRTPAADLCLRLEASETRAEELARVLQCAPGKGGQFLSAVQVDGLAGAQLTPVPRSDFVSCGDVFSEILQTETDRAAFISPERVLTFRPRPAQPTCRLDEHGRLTQLSGAPLPLHQACTPQLALFAPGVLDAPLHVQKCIYTPTGSLRIG